MQYVIPSDVAPGKFIRFTDGATSTTYTDVPLTLAGSSYTETVTGITSEGPSGNQTGTNLFDTGDYGWVSIDDELSAGQRIVLSTAFLVDVYASMPNNTIVNIGPKSTSWTDTSDINSGFQGGVRIALIKMNDGSLQAYSYRATPSAGSSGTVFFTNTAQVTSLNFQAFIEITSSGDNVRAGLRTDSTSFTDDASTTPFSDWNDKVQTGDQGYGLTNIDIMVQAIAVSGPYGDMLSLIHI